MPQKREEHSLPHGGPLASRRGPQNPWTVQEGPTGCPKEFWACGPDPLPLSLVSSSLGRALGSPETWLFLSLLSARTTSVAQLQESRQTGGQRARGSPSVPYFLPDPLALASASQLDTLWDQPRAP